LGGQTKRLALEDLVYQVDGFNCLFIGLAVRDLVSVELER
jgi:hypothetical protein